MGAFPVAKDEVIAAWIRIEPWIATKVKGDTIEAIEVERITGVSFDRLRDRIKRHFYRRGIDLQPLPNRGYLIPTGEQQITGRVFVHKKKAERSRGRLLFAASTVNDSELSETSRRVRDHVVRTIGAQIAMADVEDNALKSIMGVPAARPALKPVK